MQTENYGYEYVCPFTGLIDYIGIGNAASRDGTEGRMKSHLRQSCNGMLRQKLKLLASKGIAPIYRKVVEGLTREEVCDWEESRIRAMGTIRNGTGPLFNVAVGDPGRMNYRIKAFGCVFDDWEALSRDKRCVVDAETLLWRSWAGCGYEIAATSPVPPLDAFGQQFTTDVDLYNDSRCIVPRTALIYRMCHGEPPESAATRPLEWVGAWGKRFTSLRELSEDARSTGDYERLLAAVKYGVEQQAAAVSINGTIRFRGKTYPNLEAVVQLPECMVSWITLLSRLAREGWTVERAVTEPPEYYELFGQRYKSVQELSEHPRSKHDVATIFKLLKEGMTVEYAIGAVTPPWQVPQYG